MLKNGPFSIVYSKIRQKQKLSKLIYLKFVKYFQGNPNFCRLFLYPAYGALEICEKPPSADGYFPAKNKNSVV